MYLVNIYGVEDYNFITIYKINGKQYLCLTRLKIMIPREKIFQKIVFMIFICVEVTSTKL